MSDTTGLTHKISSFVIKYIRYVILYTLDFVRRIRNRTKTRLASLPQFLAHHALIC